MGFSFDGPRIVNRITASPQYLWHSRTLTPHASVIQTRTVKRRALSITLTCSKDRRWKQAAALLRRATATLTGQVILRVPSDTHRRWTAHDQSRWWIGCALACDNAQQDLSLRSFVAIAYCRQNFRVEWGCWRVVLMYH